MVKMCDQQLFCQNLKTWKHINSNIHVNVFIIALSISYYQQLCDFKYSCTILNISAGSISKFQNNTISTNSAILEDENRLKRKYFIIYYNLYI